MNDQSNSIFKLFDLHHFLKEFICMMLSEFECFEMNQHQAQRG